MAASDGLPGWFDLEQAAPKPLRDTLHAAVEHLAELLPELAERLDVAHRAFAPLYESVHRYDRHLEWDEHEEACIAAAGYGEYWELLNLFVRLVAEARDRDTEGIS